MVMMKVACDDPKWREADHYQRTKVNISDPLSTSSGLYGGKPAALKEDLQGFQVTFINGLKSLTHIGYESQLKDSVQQLILGSERF